MPAMAIGQREEWALQEEYRGSDPGGRSNHGGRTDPGGRGNHVRDGGKKKTIFLHQQGLSQNNFTQKSA